MTIDNLDVLFYTLIFVVPGFIIDSIYRTCVPQQDAKSESVLLRFLLFSSLNYSIVLPLLFWISGIPYFKSNENVKLYVSLLIIFIVSVLLALIISALTNKGWIRTILQKMGIHTTHVTPTAWDYQFKGEDPRYITVYLEDGGIVHGYWGSKSFASSIRDNKDLYLEKIFNVNDKKEWIEIKENKGVWIPEKSIKYFEFH
ncbi:hypothetical protein M948_10265 [Virgibacillus sp. CM-4]|uniref:DUF6338 family protein n=1 Tax=Virgibacillus sp. CM-4 TaxID=1354277 RepID=UPI00038821D5|nr:DUF6338 family protein [Virgibacillus sp. CM-4]EQB37052.1 hypothetical protein M948_10265 [Virgibacillus sp. CM-4]